MNRRRRGRTARVAFVLVVSSFGAAGLIAPIRSTGPVCWPSAYADEPLGLDQVIEKALARNPGLKAVEERSREVVAGVQEAKADAFPQLTLVSSWGRSRNPAFLNSPDFESLLDQFPAGSFRPSTQELHRLSVEVTQALYTFGKIDAAVDLARTVSELVEADIRTVRLDTAQQAADAFFEVLAARRALEIVVVQEAARQEALDVVNARYDIGEATRLEKLRAEAALYEVRPEIAVARGRVDVAQSRLEAVLSWDAEEGLELLLPVQELPEPPAAENALALARTSRPELEQLQIQRQSLAEQQRVLRAEGRPQIELTGRYGREARVFEDVTDSLFSDWALSIGLRWSFFDGFRRKGEIGQLESQREQLRLRMEQLENDIVLEIQEGLADYRSAFERKAASSLSALAAGEARRVATEGYAEGVALQADLLDAQQREVAAQIQAADAHYQAWAAATRLSRALGALPSTQLHFEINAEN